jgi:hypothetical protein
MISFKLRRFLYLFFGISSNDTKYKILIHSHLLDKYYCIINVISIKNLMHLKQVYVYNISFNLFMAISIFPIIE